MWYLLAAAGAGYLAQRWQNAHRARPVMAGCGQNPRTSPPTSSPPTPNRRSSSLSKAFSCDLGMPRKLLHDVNAGVLNTSADEECSLIGLEAPPSHFVTGSEEGNSEHLKATMSQIAASQDRSPSYQVKTNKRSAHQAFLAPVMDVLEPLQGNPKEHVVSNAFPNRDFNSIDSELKDEGGSVSPSLSLCCSSSSTVHNSPVGRQLTGQEFGSAQFQERKQKKKVIPHQQEHVFWSCEAGDMVDSSQNPLKFDALKERVQGIGFSQCHVQPEYSEQTNLLCDGNLQHTSPSSFQEGILDSLITEPNSDTNVLAIETTSNGPLVTKDNLMWDASTVKHDLFSSKRFDGNTSTASYKREVMRINNSKSEMLHPTLEIAADINCTRKAVPLLSSDHSATTENFCDSESESLVGFGVGIAVLLMVSSSKTEIEKMGKVLKETEDLVSDMRKDLDERKARSHMPLVNVGVVGNDNLPTVKIKYAAAQEQATANTDCHIDSFCEDGLSDDDESIRSVLTEEHVQGDCHMSDLEAELEAELEIMKSNMEGNDSSQKQVNHANSGEFCAGYDSDDDNASSTLEEVGETDYMVSTIELERKLWKVFQQRQEERIMELEGALELALNKLHAKEKELLWWKDRACCLMEHSSRPTSGKTS